MSLSLFGFLSLGGKAADGLKQTLERTREALVKSKELLPDLAPQFDKEIAEIDEKLAALDEPLTPASILALSRAVLPELFEISHGHINPRKHAGDGG